MGTLRFLGIIVSFKIGRTFRFADYTDSARKGGKKPGKISRLPQGHTDCTGMRKDLGEIP